MTERKQGLFTVKGEGGPPSFEEAARQIGVNPDELDRTFGIVVLDPARGLYGVQARSAAVPEQRGAKDYRGPFSDPKIEPFGPIQPEKKK